MSKTHGQVRIIGGQWRSRKLEFPLLKDLRPTPDAVRETLFNWLQFDLAGSQCLDLFAGSGAIGFEAASRGATWVSMVESNSTAVKQLQLNRDLLRATEVVEINHCNYRQFLESSETLYDIVFIDPPFTSSDLSQICMELQSNAVLAPDALIYIESAKSREALPIEPSWHIIRQKTQGLVQSTLIRTSPL